MKREEKRDNNRSKEETREQSVDEKGGMLAMEERNPLTGGKYVHRDNKATHRQKKKKGMS